MPFIEQVRTGTILQPTQKGFQRALWNQAFESDSSPDAADKDLHEAGLFFDEFLQELRMELTKGNHNQLARRDRLLGLCAIINQDITALQRKTKLRKANKEHSVLPMSELIHRHLTLTSTMATQAASIWRKNLSLQTKKALVLPRTIADIRRQSRGNPYVIKRSDQHTRRNIPEGVVGQLVAGEACASIRTSPSETSETRCANAEGVEDRRSVFNRVD